MTVIDLRSDTVTKPSAAMRRAIAEAVVGDDVLDGDPTTRLLERRVAELLGKEDSLFFPSGTQANQTGIALQTRPGTELIPRPTRTWCITSSPAWRPCRGRKSAP